LFLLTALLLEDSILDLNLSFIYLVLCFFVGLHGINICGLVLRHYFCKESISWLVAVWRGTTLLAHSRASSSTALLSFSQAALYGGCHTFNGVATLTPRSLAAAQNP
jgi:hypothetical protein